jgi:hypothetical protein
MSVIPSEPNFRMSRALNIMELLLNAILEIVLERVLTKIFSKRVVFWNTLKQCINTVRVIPSLFKFAVYFKVLPMEFPTVKEQRLSFLLKYHFGNL